jgi:hypothetical protein
MTPFPIPCYVLKDRRPIPEPDFARWAQWFYKADRQVGLTRIGPILISTVFLGLDHNFGHGSPLLFETLVFRGGDGAESRRYASWQDAQAGHAAMAQAVRAEIRQKAKS